MASIIELLKNKDYDEDIFNELNIEYVTDEIILSAAEKTLNLLKIFLSNAPFSVEKVSKSREFVNYLLENFKIN